MFVEFITEKEIFIRHKLISDEEYNKYPIIKSFAGSISIDKKDNLWFGTNFGYILKYNPNTEEKERFYFNKNFFPRTHLYVMFVKEDNEQNIWLGTWFDGLYKLSKNRKIFYHYLPEKDNENSLTNNILVTFYQDKAGYLWFGTEFAGINILKNNKKFFTISNNPKNKKSLPPFPYTCSVIDNDNNIWLGIDMGGLVQFRKNNYNNVYKFNFGKDKVERIFSLLKAKNGNIWVGTENGLFEINPKNKKIINHFKYHKDNYEGLSGKNIISICEDKEGNIWAGSIHRGITKINIAKNKFYKFVYDKDNPNGISNNYISSIYCSSEGTIWAGTLNGLCKFNSQSGTFTVFKNNPENKKSISSNKINTIFEKDNYLWIGTEAGLNKFDKKNASFTIYL